MENSLRYLTEFLKTIQNPSDDASFEPKVIFNTINSEILPKKSKQILFIMVEEMINILNESRLSKFLPNPGKHTFQIAIILKLLGNEKLIKILREIKDDKKS